MPLVFAIASYLIDGLIILLIISAVMSWFHPNPRHPVVRFVNAAVDPLLRPINALIPPLGGISFSAIIAVILLRIIQQLFLRAS